MPDSEASQARTRTPEEEKALQADIDWFTEELCKELQRRADRGRQQVKFQNRLEAFSRSLHSAARQALRNPGCEVRVTCRNNDEAVFAWGILREAMDRSGQLDEAASRIYQVELRNGSCIIVLEEQKQDVA